MLLTNRANIYEIINNAPLDQSVGIKIALLWEDSYRSYFGASIAPYKSLSAHFHNEGDELYHIINGNGFMRLGILKENIIDWKQELKVYSGDFFTVQPKTVHQLINETGENLIVIFGCNRSHLSSNRVIISEK